MRKYFVNFANFVHIFITCGKITSLGERVVKTFAHYRNFTNLAGLQPIAIKVCNFTHFKMLFLAVVTNFAYLALVKI